MKIKIFGGLRNFTDNKSIVEIEIDSEKTVKEIIDILKIPQNYVFIVAKGGKAIKKETKVRNEDEIVITPYISGG